MNIAEYQQNRKQLLKSLDQLRNLRDQAVLKDAELTSQMSHDFRSRMLNLDRESNRLRNPDLTVAFVGGFSAGKSSLINAFLGRYLLPESTKVTTAVPTFVRSTKSDNEEAELHYLSDEELDALDDLYRREIAAAYTNPDLESLSIHELLEQVAKLSGEGRCKKLAEYLEIFHKERYERSSENVGAVVKIPLAEVSGYISDEKEAMFLDKIVLRIKNDKIPEDVVLVDLPGISVPNPRHREITFRFIRNDANAVVFVFMATRLFDKDELEIAEIFRKGDSEIAEKTFWVLNRWDSLTSEQQKQTIDDFSQKMRDLKIAEPNAFRTNALHGLLSQLALKNELDTNVDLQKHLPDYKETVQNRYEGDHGLVLTESQLPALQQEIFDFLNTRIRLTTLKTAKSVGENDFCLPVLSKFRELRRFGEEKTDRDLAEREKTEIGASLEESLERRKREIIQMLHDVRIEVVEKRDKLLPPSELETRLSQAIDGGEETDAYQIYLEILAEKKLRKFPYYFEIESQIVDKLNMIVKEQFLADMKATSSELLNKCREEVRRFIDLIGEDVEYAPDVIEGINNCLLSKERDFYSGIELVVQTHAAHLDALLVYKEEKGFFFTTQSEIFQGLEKAAKHGYEKIGKISNDITKDDFLVKTMTIRETLKKHYVLSVKEFRKQIAENISPPFINILQKVQDAIVTELGKSYRPAREKVLATTVSEKYGVKRKELESRLKKYRTWMEQIERIQNEMEIKI